MTKQKMTIHRALSELKLIDSRIQKSIQNLIPSGSMQEGKLVNGFYSKADFDKRAKSNLQSVTDLIERKHAIKSAITNANSVTMVNFAGVSMTISEAINYKNIISLKKSLIRHIVEKHNEAKVRIEQNNKQVDENALRLAQAALQKDNVKINDGDAIAITEPYIKKNMFTLVNPLDVENLEQDLQRDIIDFEAEVDSVLSEINALTTIEI